MQMSCRAHSREVEPTLATSWPPEALRVLVIDDNPADRLLIEQKLRGAARNLTVIPVGSAAELDTALAGGFDGAITEFELPFGTGLEVYRRLAEIHPQAPVILFTSRGTESLRMRALDAGLTDYLTKSPDNYDRLERTLIAELDRLRHQSDLERQAAVINLTSDAIIVRHEDGRVQFWNRGAQQMYGYDASEVIGRSLHDLLKTRFPEPLEAIMRKLAAEGVWMGELEHQTRHGRTVRVLSRWQRGRARPGQEILESNTDITRQRLAEEQLLASERRATEAQARLAAIAAASSEAIIGKDLQGCITCWNGGAEQLFGYRASEVLGKSVYLIVPPELYQEEQEILSRMRRGEATETYETTRRRKDGTFVPVSVSVSPVKDDQGVVIGGSKIARDITRRKRIQERLRASEARYRETFDSAAVGIAHVGLNGRWLHFNEAVCAITGYSREVLRQLTFIDITHPEDRELSQAQADRLLSGQIQSYSLEKRYVRPGGELVWVHVTVSVSRNSAEQPAHFIAALQDISERKEFEERVQNLLHEREQLLEAERSARAEAEAANHLKDEFLATLSHELRTPLSNVLTWARLLQQKYPGAEDPLRRGLTVIVENAGMQAQMISELLDMSRIASGKLQLDRSTVNLGELVEAALLSQRPAAEAKGLTLSLRKVDESLLISADATRLQQVLWNLLSNAIKFTPAGGSIQVSIRSAGAWAELTILDTGVGIPAAFLPHVFDRFRQAEATTTRRFGGLGLGLAIVKQLVQLHGGSVQARSFGEGSGATFIVRLPRGRQPAGVPDTPHAIAGAAPGIAQISPEAISGLRILAVDDEPATLDVLARVLTEYGARVTAVGSAAQALETLRNTREFDILLSDLGMPEMDGFALLKTVRASFPAEELPAVAVTAFSRAQDRVRAEEAGFQGYIMKPYDIAELITLVRELNA
jgi:PAS domain S-box-containing protein